ncbi:nucleotidyltransferase domain-containing protein [Candidatus Poribacteria bacterium]|nr:nucleotidyltransferase domain-containing protein [Candidatus Poribacteria bacterium]
MEAKNHAAVEARRVALQAELERLVRVLVEQYAPECIILYGSFAQGEIHEWSDLDLCVIKRMDKPLFARLEEVALLVLPRVGCDIIVYTPEEFEAAKRRRHYWIVDEILGKGRLLYQKKEDGYAGELACLCAR